MKTRFSPLFPFTSYDPHDTIKVVSLHSPNDLRDSRNGGHDHAHLGNQIGKQVLCIDEAYGHSKGVS